MTSASDATKFVNATADGEIPTFQGDERAKATDFANYFCSYAQLYHQKQMLCDHNRMASYHSAILGNAEVFKDKIVLDVGTGSGILAVWAAQAGAAKVYAIEYTDMAKYARKVMEANKVDHIVTVIQAAVEDVELPDQDDIQCVDIIVSEWMGYFLLRESMLDSIVRARDKFLKPNGLMFPSHCTMYLAPVYDEDERRNAHNDYASAMSDWQDFENTTNQVYGVDMLVLQNDYDREQKDYYLLSSRWTELPPEAVLAEPVSVKHLNLSTCTLQDARGVENAKFDFEIIGNETHGPISGLAGWFTADFRSRTDTSDADTIAFPAYLSTGPENGYTHWGQQTFYFMNSIPVLRGQTVQLTGSLDMTRTNDNSRLYNCKICYSTSRRKDGHMLMESKPIEQVYQIP